MTAETILIVEDELALRETLSYSLKKNGYAVEVVDDGRLAVETARKIRPDLILLDVMLPGMDGFEVCRILRRDLTTPILMLTARDSEVDRVTGLEVGADDYLSKPFSMRELLARVKAQLRRAQLLRDDLGQMANLPTHAQNLVFDSLIINQVRREVTLDGEVLPLKPKEYDLLLFFAKHRGRMLSREFILEQVWGWEYIGDSRTVDVHVRWLRQKLETNTDDPHRIVTVRRGGYRFEG